MVWSHARLVAFDVPGLSNGKQDDPEQQWTYGARYELLRHVVGAWARKVTGEPNNNIMIHTSYPLQLIRQYNMKELPNMFREVVHGVPWEDRKYPGFGIPRTQKVDLTGRGNNVWRAYEAFDWLPEDGDTVALFRRNVRASGEGLMLWRQDAPWQMAGGHRTQAILKYKPTVLTVRVVFAPPEKTHHRENNNDDGRLPGYHVCLRWWDDKKGHGTYVAPCIPAAFEPGRDDHVSAGPARVLHISHV